MGDRFLSKYSKKILFGIPDLIRNLNLKDGKQISGEISTSLPARQASVGITVLHRHSYLDQKSYNKVKNTIERKTTTIYILLIANYIAPN